MDLEYGTPDGKPVFEENTKVRKFKRWFKEAVDASKDWRDVAHEDQDFFNGVQWSKAELASMGKLKKPPITINRIAPMINLVSGWQRLNRYDIDFLPRTGDDTQKAKLRKAITKYVMDESNYDDEESAMFTCSEITGLGWLEVGYKFDPELGDGDAFIRQVSEFDMYVDPEAHDRYFRDAKYVIRARWVDKEELKSDYPEYAEEIEAQTNYYMEEEDEEDPEDKYWYQREMKKIRLAECWYKTSKRTKVYILQDGTVLYEPPDELTIALVVNEIEYTKTEVRMIAFFNNVVLEDIASPYKHGELPFVPMPWSMHNSVPHGVVYSLKDLQREYNKRRSQQMHILNTTANSGWIVEEGALSQQELAELKRSASQPGVVIKVASGTLTTNRIRRLEPQASPAAVEGAAIDAATEFMSASGINESLLGTDVSNLASGRAIELKQKQAITHLAVPFDALRFVKKRVAFLLWGGRGKPGIIPQFYTEEKTFRITSDNSDTGYDFVTVNQKQQQQDPMTGQIITQTLNDLSIGDFDIVVSDSPTSATARMGEFWSLVEALSQIGLTGDKAEIALDMLIELLNIPQKDELKKRLQERQAQAQQQQQQQMQMQMEIEQQKHLAKNIAYKDLQLPMQLQLAAKAGIFPQQYADAFMQWSIQQYANSMGIAQNSTSQNQPGLAQMPQPNGGVVNRPPMPQQGPQVPINTNGQNIPLNANGRPMFYR